MTPTVLTAVAVEEEGAVATDGGVPAAEDAAAATAGIGLVPRGTVNTATRKMLLLPTMEEIVFTAKGQRQTSTGTINSRYVESMGTAPPRKTKKKRGASKATKTAATSMDIFRKEGHTGVFCDAWRSRDQNEQGSFLLPCLLA